MKPSPSEHHQVVAEKTIHILSIEKKCVFMQKFSIGHERGIKKGLYRLAVTQQSRSSVHWRGRFPVASRQFGLVKQSILINKSTKKA